MILFTQVNWVATPSDSLYASFKISSSLLLNSNDSRHSLENDFTVRILEILSSAILDASALLSLGIKN